MKSNSVNAEHVHTLIDLPTSKSIEEVMHLLKGSSSHWVNEQRLLPGKFSWGRGYGSFSVSHSHANQVVGYLAVQEKYHRRRTFRQEFETLVKKHGLEWHDR
jgi:REP element-mobilizing transposase RayT